MSIAEHAEHAEIFYEIRLGALCTLGGENCYHFLPLPFQLTSLLPASSLRLQREENEKMGRGAKPPSYLLPLSLPSPRLTAWGGDRGIYAPRAPWNYFGKLQASAACARERDAHPKL